MNTFTVERATLATLPDAYALHPDRTVAERQLAQTRERIAAGKATPEQAVILRLDGGVRATAFIAENPRVPLFPRVRADVPSEGQTQFFRFLLEAAPNRILLLDSSLTTLDPAPALTAGWLSMRSIWSLKRTLRSIGGNWSLALWKAVRNC